MVETKSSPFTQAVVTAMRRLYPEQLADSSFDNTGLLLEAPHRSHLKNSVLLTIDLTKAVADEAIARRDSIIVAYHPIVFRPLKALTLANSQQSSLLRLAQEGISVYCPHTAVDAVPGGLTDWLASVLVSGAGEEWLDRIGFGPTIVEHDRTVITPVAAVPGHEGAGYGRIVRFKTPQKLGTLVERIMERLGSRPSLSVAVPQSVSAGTKSDIPISSVGVCAGSGGSMLSGLDVDMLFTGELSHHEALAAIEQEKIVVTAFHSNTERAFLGEVMLGKLNNEISKFTKLQLPGIGTKWEVAVSKVDRDPFETVVLGQTGW